MTMKPQKHLFTLSILLPFLLISCERFGESATEPKGELRISFQQSTETLTRSYSEVPDTSDFILTIKGSDGTIVYEGRFGDCPEKLDVAGGTYSIRAVSGKSAKPAFNSPIFGDEQCIKIMAGGTVNVKLLCTQLNAGIKLIVSKNFLTECPDGVLILRSAEGSLMYSYSETRTAYFQPGTVSLILNTGGSDEVLMTRELMGRDMLSIRIDVSVSDKELTEGINMQIDTSRVWMEEKFVLDAGSDSGSDGILTVADARTSAGREDIWVSGYIVGGDLTSASASFEAPFESPTNLLLGPRSSTKDKNACISVQLPAGYIRDEVNLVNNPGNLKRRICIRGDIVSAYFGIPGLKNITEYKFN